MARVRRRCPKSTGSRRRECPPASGPGGAGRHGRCAFTAPLANITRWRIEGPWAWITAIGLRRSVRHGDISFAGSPRGGVRLDFATPVRWWRLAVPAIYCGVDDPEGFAAAVAARDIGGEDVRTSKG